MKAENASKKVSKHLGELAFQYFTEKESFSKIETSFKKTKAIFYNEIDKAIGAEDEITVHYIEDETSSKAKQTVFFNIKKVIRTSVTFHADKLKESLSKEIQKRVISKSYTVNNMDGLVAMLKEYGVNPKEFKKFIDVRESVNVQELERLEAIGKIDKEEIEGCYTVSISSTSYKVNRVGTEGNGE